MFQYDLSLGHISSPTGKGRTTYHCNGTAGTIFLYRSKRRNKDETVVTFTAHDERSAVGDHLFKKWVDQAIKMI